MKKFWMGLISVMVLLTGGILSACGQGEISIELNETHKEICLNDDSLHEVNVTARVNGVDEGKVSVSSSYENIALATVTYNSITGANVITIKGVSEGNAEIVVTSNFDSSVRSVISVTVYSNITSMTQKEEDLTDGRSNLFALRNEWNTLNASDLLDIKPINARKNITYRPKTDAAGITIEGNKLFVGPEYTQDTVTITAVSETGIEADITLTIIEKLDASTISMEYSAHTSQGFIPLADGKIQIVPNIASDENYTAYIRFSFATVAGVDAQPKIFLAGDEDNGNISISRHSSKTEGGRTEYIYEVKASQGKEGLNATFNAYFDVGYTRFNHSVQSKSFKIACYEKINKMNVYNAEGQDITFGAQTIYSAYAFTYGAKYQVELLPNSVINATGKFEIRVDYGSLSGGTIPAGYNINENTLQFYYREKTGTIVGVNMESAGNGFTFVSGADLPYGTELYIMADQNIPTQLTGVRVSFISSDNPDVKVENVQFNLYKSASNLEFGFSDNNPEVNLSTTAQNSVTKTISLEGQTSIEGLYIETKGEGFTASNIVKTGETSSSVTFQVTFRVNVNSIGVTRDCSYSIKHRNGLSSEDFKVHMFLPLTDARIEYDNSSSAVTRASYGGELYVAETDGSLTRVNSNGMGLSGLLIQSGLNVPIQMYTNLSNGHYADARVTFKYLDYETAKGDDKDYDVDIFDSLQADAIFKLATQSDSTHVSMTRDTLISTNHTGHCYIVVSFSGLSEAGNEVTYVRIIKVENYVAPTQFVPSPSYSELYAYDSVGSDNFNETIQRVNVKLSDVALTYNKNINNFSFELSNDDENGTKLRGTIVGDNSVIFQDAHISLSNVVLTETGISFTINALTTSGQSSVTDYLTISYHNNDLRDNVFKSCVVTVRIINADRVEKVTWENDREDGLYFEVGDNSSQVLVFSTQPTNVKNYQLTYIPTDSNGNSSVSDFVQVRKLGQDGEVFLQSSVGMKGFIYVLPTDAINQERISYYVLNTNGKQEQKSIESSRIHEFYNSADFQKAYFINNNGQHISFTDIVCQVPVTIANGSSEELAYRIFTESEFKNIQTDKFYRIMRTLNLSDWTSFDNLTGGIFGDNEDITINLNGASLVNRNSGLIKDLIFTGEVVGDGFVAKENLGEIKNVTIDVQVNSEGFTSSKLSSDGQYVGGLVGKNAGSIENVKVLGLTIKQTAVANLAEGQTRYVGGIIGQNLGGRITNARFEIYGFKAATGENEKTTNTISGPQFVGGVIGEYAGGSVEKVYIYDYTLTKDAPVSKLTSEANTVGALVGSASAALIIRNSFAVVGNFAPVSALNENSLTFIGYISYYDPTLKNEDGTESEDKHVAEFYNGGSTSSTDANSSAFIASGNGFYSYVNGGKAHLRDFYQDEAVGSLEGYEVEEIVVERNNYYKAFRNGSGAIMLYYGVESGEYQLMTDSERRDLESLNTISFAQLFGKESAKNLVISSKDASVLEIRGRNIIVKNTGRTTLTIYSRQNFENPKIINVDIVYALSNLEVRRSGSSVAILDNQELNVQKGKSISVIYNFEHAYTRLGTRGNSFKLLENDYKLETEVTTVAGENQSLVEAQRTGSLNITYTTGLDSIKTTFEHYLSLTNAANGINDVVKNVFTRTYSVVPFAGAIEIGGNVSEVSITPSTVGTITITLKTAQENDSLTPSLSLMHGQLAENLTDIEHAEGSNLWIFDDKIRVEILSNQNNAGQEPENNLYTYRFTVKVSVDNAYRGLIDSDKIFRLSLASNAQVVSEDVTIKVTRQEFTNVTALNFRVNNTLYGNLDGQNRTYYTINNSTSSVLSPGSSSILRVDINPSFAYYDHLSIEYSGSDVAGALRIDFLKVSSDGEKFYIDNASRTETSGNSLTVYPISHDQLYFKLWASNLIEKDLNLTLTIKFYAADSNDPITFIKYFLNISYMQEPRILVDGHSTAILAKGQTAEVRIVVPYDYDIEISSIITENIEYGIVLSEKLKEEENAGNRTYFYRLSARVDAKLRESSEGAFNIRATVRRVINGVEEVKYTYAIINLVDFKIDNNNIQVSNSETDTFTTHLGIYRPLNFDYPLLPEEYSYDKSDEDSVEAYESIQAKIKDFQEHGYFADNASQYHINYTRDNAGNPTDTPYKMYQLIKFHASNDQWISIYDGEKFTSAGGYLDFNYDEVSNSISVKGLNSTPSAAPLEFKLTTYVQVGNHYYEYEYIFKIEVKVYSDEDTPLLIDSAEKFYQMAEGDPQNYILMKDITLTNHTPFDTNNISSFDGNGYTINIESFNLTPSSSSTLDLALFKNVVASTTLKNVRVNIQNGGQLVVDLANNWTQIRVAGFAISNAGIITNSEVVAFGSNGNNRGLSVKYIRGQGTSQTIYITDTSTWSSQMAGFVISNSGSITNSRVGGETITTIGDTRYTSDKKGIIGFNKEEITLNNFYMQGQGDMAGFTLENSGTIAASFVKNFGMYNESNSSTMTTSGFVKTNSGKILTSYAEGVSDNDLLYTRKGSSLRSKLGIIAGFVETNRGTISDAYSNFLISNSSEEQQSYLASGFVYSNEGTLENCLSVSQVASSKYSQMNFSGVSSTGVLLANGEYINCYYYSENNTNSSDTTEESYNTGALRLQSFENEEQMYGFTFNSAEGGVDGIWTNRNSSSKVPRLIEPDNIAFSNRYRVDVDDEPGKYLLPYSTLYEGSRGQEIFYGSESNPIIIRNAQEFVNVTGLSKSEYISRYFTPTSISGTYRLVSDIDLSELLTEDEDTVNLPSTSKAFNGRLYGNGFTIKNLSIASSTNSLSYGLFASIESVGMQKQVSSALVTNIKIELKKVSNTQAHLVGGLAGFVRDASIINVSVTNDEDAIVEGLNFVGGVAGMVFGNSNLKNVNIDAPNVVANRFVTNGTQDNNVLSASAVTSLRGFIINDVGNVLITNTSTNNITTIIAKIDGYSYAGGIIGYADIYKKGEANVNNYVFKDKMDITDYDIIRMRVTTSANIQAQVSGGLFGFIGSHTDVKDAGIIFDDTASRDLSRIISTKFYAGGIAGQSMGSMAQAFAEYSADTQENIENSLSSYYGGNTSLDRGGLNIFTTRGLDRTYSQEAVGGLIGLVNSGKLTVSYSKVNVIALNSNFVGGLIGKVNSGAAGLFYVNDGMEDVDTNFYINEVYATGDVRAKTRTDSNENFAAGGLIGRAEKNSRIIIKAANAVNFISLRNYEFDMDYLAEQLKNEGKDSYSFNNVNVYSILGSFDSRIENINDESYEMGGTDVLRLLQVREKLETGESRASLSVGTVKTYNTSILALASEVKIEAFEGADKLSAKDNDGRYIKTEGQYADTFGIPSISNYRSIEEGYHETYGVFLGTHLWERANWNHNEGNLYPKIRFSLAIQEFIWLDAYDGSIAQFFEMAPGSDIEVRVRGRLAGNSEVVGHIDIAKYMVNHGVDPIEGFRGTIKGDYSGINTTNDKNSCIIDGWAGERPAIVLDKPLFDNTSEGFLINNVTFKYIHRSRELYSSGKDNSLYNSEYKGALVNGDISGGDLRAVTMEFYANEGSKAINLQDSNNVGLVASAMHNTNINGLTIYIKDVLTSSNFLNASANNIGLVAGKIDINDMFTSHYAENIKIISAIRDTNNTNELNSIVIADGVQNLGGYFGVVERAQTAESDADVKDLDIGLGQMVVTAYTQDSSQWRNGDVSDISNTLSVKSSADTTNTINVGGYIGKVSYVKGITLEAGSGDNGAILNNTTFRIQSQVGLNAGGFIGAYFANTNLTLTPMKSENQSVNVKSHVIAKDLKTSNLGGLIGTTENTTPNETSGGSVTISNIYTQFGVSGISVSGTDNPIETGTFKDNYKDTLKVGKNYAFNAIKVSGNANVGGLIGNSVNAFTYSNTEKAEFSAQNGNGENFVMAVNATGSLNMGGLIGYAQNVTEITSTSNANKLTSSAVIYGTGDTTNLGGLIGKQDCTVNDTTPDRLRINAGASGDQSTVDFIGQIYTSSSANVGGIVGSVTTGSNANGSVTINKTAFGGAIKVFDAAEKVFNIGGTIGNFDNGTKTEYKLILQNNSNYGDVFMLSKHGTMAYGGLIGYGPKLLSGSTIGNNYILNTLNDQYPNAADEAINAVFGSVDPKINESSSIPLNQNYYNHAVCLSSDDNAIDAGYKISYETSRKVTGGGYKSGYDGFGDEGKKASLSEKVASNVNFNDNDNAGHKLNPIKITSTISNANTGKEIKSFNGMTYYYIDGSATFNNQIAESIDNVAIIGDTYTMKISFNSATNAIKQMSGCSFISGMLVENISKFDVAEGNETVYGGLVQTMKSGTIYAVGVTGSMDIGGTKILTIGGLVGQMDGGLIKESFTDVQMLYRGAKDEKNKDYGQIAAFAGNTSVGIITYSYAVGTVECYIDSKLDGFSFGGVTVRYSYSTANLEWHDYTSSKTAEDARKGNQLTMFSDAICDAKSNGTTNTLVYDKYVNGNISGSGNAKETRGTEGIVIGYDNEKKSYIFANELGSGWTTSSSFNYSYPTRKFNYLQLSSLFARGADKASAGEAERGIANYEYTRLSRADMAVPGFNSNDGSKYFAIPNAGIWSYGAYAYGTPNLILRNDLYMNYLRADENTNNSQKDLYSDFSLALTPSIDGCGHKIYNYKSDKQLLGYIPGTEEKPAEIRNLDILNASVNSSSVLSAIANNAILSNITLSGDLALERDPSLSSDLIGGGLLSRATGSTKIHSVMSNLNVRGNNVKIFGGIVGQIHEGSKVILDYCVNNGPIAVKVSAFDYNYDKEDEIKNKVGGIVGESQEAIIKYCYNTSSVLANYTASISSFTLNCGGGIVGYSVSNTIIDHCLNSGLVYVGNKSETKAQYAGGIIGYLCGDVNITWDTDGNIVLDDDGNINATNGVANCINEGSVQALAMNADYDVRGVLRLWWSDNPAGSVVDKIDNAFCRFEVVQITEKNVYAECIGYGDYEYVYTVNPIPYWDLETGTWKYQEITVQSIPEKHMTNTDYFNPEYSYYYNYNSSKDIIANGAALQAEQVVWNTEYVDTRKFEKIVDGIIRDINYYVIGEGDESIEDTFMMGRNTGSNVEMKYGFYKRYSDLSGIHYRKNKDEYIKLDSKLLVITARDEYNMPTAFYAKKNFDFSYTDSLTYHTYVAEQFSIDHDFKGYAQGTDVYQEKARSSVFINSTGETETGFKDLRLKIIEDTPASGDITQTVMIAGNSYYLANSSGKALASRINNAKVYRFSLDGLNLPKGTSTNYTLTYNDEDNAKDFQFIIESIEGKDNNVKINVIAYCFNEETALTGNVTVEYNKEINETVDLSECNYSYFVSDDISTGNMQGTIIINGVEKITDDGVEDFIPLNAISIENMYIPIVTFENNERKVVYFQQNMYKAELNGQEIFLNYDRNGKQLKYFRNIIEISKDIEENFEKKEYQAENGDTTIYYELKENKEEAIEALKKNKHELNVSDFANQTLEITMSFSSTDNQSIELTNTDEAGKLNLTNPKQGNIDLTPEKTEIITSGDTKNIVFGDKGTGNTNEITLNNVSRANSKSVSKTAQTIFSGVVVPSEPTEGEGGEEPIAPAIAKIKFGEVELLNDSTFANSVTIGGKEFVCNYDVDTKMLTLTYTGELASADYEAIKSEFAAALTVENCTWSYSSMSQEKDLYNFNYNISIAGDKAMTFVNNKYSGTEWINPNDIECEAVNLTASASGNVLELTAQDITQEKADAIKSALDSLALTYDSLTYTWIAPTNVDNWVAGYVKFEDNIWSKAPNGTLTEGLDKTNSAFRLTLTDVDANSVAQKLNVAYAYQLIDLGAISGTLNVVTSENKVFSSNNIITANVKYLYENFEFASDIFTAEKVSSTDSTATYSIKYDLNKLTNGLLNKDDIAGFDIYWGTINNATYTAKTKYTGMKVGVDISATKDYYVEINTTNLNTDETNPAEKYFASSEANKYMYSTASTNAKIEATIYPYFEYGFKNDKGYSIDAINSFEMYIRLAVDQVSTNRTTNEEVNSVGTINSFISYRKNKEIFESPQISEDELKYYEEDDNVDVENKGYCKIFAVKKADNSFRFYYNLWGIYHIQYINEYTNENGTYQEERKSTIDFININWSFDTTEERTLPTLNEPISTENWDSSFIILDENGNEIKQDELKPNSWDYKPNNSSYLTINGRIYAKEPDKDIILADEQYHEEKLPIILNRNINLGLISPMILGVGIYGDDHILSYMYDNSILVSVDQGSADYYAGLFTNINDGGRLKDLNIVGQVVGRVENGTEKYASIVAYQNQGEIIDTKVLGSIRTNNEYTSGILNKNSGTIKTPSMFASIKSLNPAAKLSDVTTFDTNSDLTKISGTIKVGGVIVAANGTRGASGKNGEQRISNSSTRQASQRNSSKARSLQNVFSQFEGGGSVGQIGYGADGANGTSGKNGGSITLISSQNLNLDNIDKVVVSGVYTAGRGGNGGAGGVGANGKVQAWDEYSYTGNVNGGNGGNKGIAGSSGSVKIQKNETSDDKIKSDGAILITQPEAIAGSSGCGGMHGWIIPKVDYEWIAGGWHSYVFGGGPNYTFAAKANRFISKENLKVGTTGDSTERTYHASQVLDARNWVRGEAWIVSVTLISGDTVYHFTYAYATEEEAKAAADAYNGQSGLTYSYLASYAKGGNCYTGILWGDDDYWGSVYDEDFYKRWEVQQKLVMISTLFEGFSIADVVEPGPKSYINFYLQDVRNPDEKYWGRDPSGYPTGTLDYTQTNAGMLALPCGECK